MPSISRRTALGLIALGAVSTSSARASASPAAVPTANDAGGTRNGAANPVVRENQHRGDGGWRIAARASDDVTRQIQGYAAKTSVNAGDSLDFHVSVAGDRTFTVAVYRLGHYGGAGGRRMMTSGWLQGRQLPAPAADPRTGAIACDWPVAWTLPVAEDWASGYFLAVFETDDGYRSCTPFVVRNDQRTADFLVVVPFSTYQAYNMWPADGRTGKNLYKGYVGSGKIGKADSRAFQVSFDRPYSGAGLPMWSELEIAAVRWLEASGFDVAYASSLDLHEGSIPPGRHAGMIFPGHDEYWSQAMRDTAENAVDHGTHLAFLAANNVYWHVRFDAASDGRPNRVVTCYKDSPDPHADRHGPTKNWRRLGKLHSRAEQRLLGVQYNGMLAKPVPLVVSESRHWFWAGTGVRAGDRIPGLVAVEADGWNPKIEVPRAERRTLLSNTPYQDQLGRGRRVQNTSLYETAGGAIVFAAATFHWTLALVPSPYTDTRIQRATKNLLVRMTARPQSTGTSHRRVPLAGPGSRLAR